MSNKSTAEKERNIRQELLVAKVQHASNVNLQIDDEEIMLAEITRLEQLYRKEVDARFKHFDDKTYNGLGLESPQKKQTRAPVLPPKPESSLESDMTDTADTEEIVFPEDISEFTSTDDTQSPRSESESPRNSEKKQPATNAPNTAKEQVSTQSKIELKQGWITTRLTQQPLKHASGAQNTTPVQATSTSKINFESSMQTVLTAAKKIAPEKKTQEISEALISAENNLRQKKVPCSDALKEIFANIGTKKTIKGIGVLVLDRKESAFLKEFMKIESLKDVVKDRNSLVFLQDTAQSLPKNKRDVILGPLEATKKESAKNTAQAPTKK